MAICETTVHLMDEMFEHPRMDLLRVVELMPWRACMAEFHLLDFYWRPHIWMLQQACIPVFKCLQLQYQS